MDKKPLIVVSICAVVLLVLGSLSNVVGYQTVQSSNQSIIKERINQRELLLQTILDIANNKEIQRIILKSQISRGEFFTLDARFSMYNTPVLTKNHLKQMYLIGFILSKIISKSKMHSIIEKYQLNNQVIQKEISAVIEKYATLDSEITALSNSKCDCENENSTDWTFPILCEILDRIFWSFFWIAGFFFMLFSYLNGPILKYILGGIGMFFTYIAIIFSTLGDIFNCSFLPYFI